MSKRHSRFSLDRHQTFASSIFTVSRAKCCPPQSQNTPGTNIIADTTKKATFKFVRSSTAPMSGGAAASPNKWMMKMLTAKAVARTPGFVTFANAVLAGPVLKKRKKIARNIIIQPTGNGVKSINTEKGNAITTRIPDTRKWDQSNRFLKKRQRSRRETVAFNRQRAG